MLSEWLKARLKRLLGQILIPPNSGELESAGKQDSRFTKNQDTMSKRTIHVQGHEIKLMASEQSDFISLTDLTQGFEGGSGLIEKWLRNKNTVEFLGMWEKLYNPDFVHDNYEEVFREAGLNRFMLSVKRWIEQTGAIGIKGSAGRYGGTYAHKDIALEFCSWLSPLFKLYVIREFDRLKQEEHDRLASEWDVRRLLSKVNYFIHTDAVRSNLVPIIDWNTRKEGFFFASEADVLNVAVFGMTAGQWRQAYPSLKGNMRDHASHEQLVVLANLEAMNAEMIREGLSQDERARKLNEIAIYQMRVLGNLSVMAQLPKGKE